ncbi:hypothetical protein ACE1EF_01755 [Saccharicrinis sp. FJH54]
MNKMTAVLIAALLTGLSCFEPITFGLYFGSLLLVMLLIETELFIRLPEFLLHQLVVYCNKNM